MCVRVCVCACVCVFKIPVPTAPTNPPVAPVFVGGGGGGGGCISLWTSGFFFHFADLCCTKMQQSTIKKTKISKSII